MFVYVDVDFPCCRRMCWKLVSQTGQTAIFQKQADPDCVGSLRESSNPPLCEAGQDVDAAWYFPMQPCISRNPQGKSLIRIGPR